MIAVCLLTVVFTISSVSGIKKGIRLMSNANMTLVVLLGIFALIAGPAFYLLDLLPVSIVAFFGALPDMLSVYAGQGQTEQEFLTAWTTLYWA